MVKIEVEVGKQGTLTPVAHLRPVKVAGSTVEMATLHNAFEVRPFGSLCSSIVVTMPTPVGNAPIIAKNVARSIKPRQPPSEVGQR